MRFRWRAIDFVGQQKVSEDRAATQAEGRRRHVEDIRAGDIRRHQVRRELNAPEAGIDDARERFDSERFGRARDAFDERVTFSE